MLNAVSYGLWWSILTIFRIIQYIVIAIAPTFVVEKIIVEKFKNFGISITIVDEANTSPEKRKTNSCEIIVLNRKLFKRVAIDDLLALGEAYMDGWWDCDNLAELSSRLTANYNPMDTPLIPLQEKVELARNQHTRESSLRVINDHYNLGNDIYETMLDPTMNYSCAYWKEDTQTLEQAQINKMDLIARKLKLKPGMKVLDIGCGFGATAKYLAQNYGVSVVGYNISKEQVAWATEACRELDVEFRMEDYRNAVGKYDRIYSVGFFEHVGVRNYREFFKICERCLKDDGLLLLHSITESDTFQPRTNRWLSKYIFPGGELPYPAEYFTHSEGLFLAEDVHSFGLSYKLTLLEWYKNFTSNWHVLEDEYAGYHDGKFQRMWSFYLLLCAGFFDAKALTVFQVVYSKKGSKMSYESVR